MTWHNNQQFSTKDNENDAHIQDNCAALYSGAWWYGACHQSNLNGIYGTVEYGKGVNWYPWKGYDYSLAKTEIKIRPKNPCYSNPCNNGGTCAQIGITTEFNCSCPDGFSGDICEIDPCYLNPCNNGGTCAQIGITTEFNCSCPEGFSGDICEIDWIEFGDYYYHFENDKKKSWNNAKTACRYLGGDLIAVNSNDVGLFITDKGDLSYGGYWIGLNDEETEGVWVYGNNIANYNNWAAGQPVEGDTSQNCVIIWRSTGEWDDSGCSNEKSYICQKLKFSCPSGWMEYGHDCYRRETTSLTWEDSRMSCINHNSDLVVIKSDDVNTFLFETFNLENWIGLSDISTFFEFDWIDGSNPLYYNNWSPNEPSAVPGQHCVWLNGTKGKWDNINCNESKPSICQKPKEPCDWSPCQNGGTCSNGEARHICDCGHLWYYGENCTKELNQNTKGTGFVVGFMETIHLDDIIQLLLVNAEENEAAATVTVTSPHQSFSSVISVNKSYVLSLPSTLSHSGNERSTKGLRVLSNLPLSIYGLQGKISGKSTADTFLALPNNIISKEYIVITYSVLGDSNDRSQFLVIGVEDDTFVQLTVTGSVTYNGISYSAGDSFSLTLNTLDSVQFQSQGDLTGSKVSSSKIVSVFSGNKHTRVPSVVTWNDYIVSQAPPLNLWGYTYITTPLATRTAGDIFRVLASEDDTTVTISGLSSPVILDSGQFKEIDVPSNESWLITADAPILVAQFCKGEMADLIPFDPFMIILPSLDNFITGIYALVTMDIPGTENDKYFINIIVNCSVKSQLLSSPPIDISWLNVDQHMGFCIGWAEMSFGNYYLGYSEDFYQVLVYAMAINTALSYGHPLALQLDVTDPCNPNPCNNGGTCAQIDVTTEFNCSCPDSFSGDICEIVTPISWACPEHFVFYPALTSCTNARIWWSEPKIMNLNDSIHITEITSTHRPGDIFDLGNMTIFYSAKSKVNTTSTCVFTIEIKESTQCPPGWAEYGDNCYVTHKESGKSWQEARTSCQSTGGDLAVIYSESLNNLLMPYDTAVWIGLKFRFTGEDQYGWIDGHNNLYTNWEENHPGGDDSNSCGMMEIGNFGKWTTIPCDYKAAGYICQRPSAMTSKCIDEVVGMGDLTVPDSAISASSSLLGSNGPEHGRLWNHNGAWTAGNNDSFPELQIDLGYVRKITRVSTQGNPSTDQWITSYKLSYSVDNCTWDYVKDDAGSVWIFEGNINQNMVITNLVDIKGRYVRLLPLTKFGKNSLRMELHAYKDISYTYMRGLSKTLKEAQEYCEESNGRLVRVFSNYVQNKLQKVGDSLSDNVWVDAVWATGQEVNSWKYLDGTPLPYTNWAENEPQMNISHTTICASLTGLTTGKVLWRSERCNNSLSFFCEYTENTCEDPGRPAHGKRKIENADGKVMKYGTKIVFHCPTKKEEIAIKCVSAEPIGFTTKWSDDPPCQVVKRNNYKIERNQKTRRAHFYREGQDLAVPSSVQPILVTNSEYSAFICSQYCLENNDCFSFAYSTTDNDNNCKLYQGLYTISKLVSSPGTEYYRVKEA